MERELAHHVENRVEVQSGRWEEPFCEDDSGALIDCNNSCDHVRAGKQEVDEVHDLVGFRTEEGTHQTVQGNTTNPQYYPQNR